MGRRQECPPHIFGVAEGSYQGMQNAGKNQSILITGESGAGKTENTKKVISYFASIGASGKKKEGEPGLEDKIVQTNPVLEAWGNAKTVRNDNSSRFGKFIRIWFNAGGKLSGADMVIYLLEKSRLTFQAELERCYHSFYNIMSDQVPDCKEKCHLSNDIYDYWWVSQGKTTVPSIDDKEDMMFAHEAYDILGFTQEEKYNVYKLTAVVMHMGNLTKDFVPVGKEEQAEVKNETNAEKVADICGIDKEWMVTYFCKPKLKLTQEATNDMERIKSELEQSITRKDKEITSMSAKIDDELTLSSKYNNQIKDLQQRIEELDEELTIERSNRAKAEKNRSTLSRDIGDLAEKLEDSGNNTTTLIELNKKREANLAKLKAQLDESNVAHEGTLAALRQKHNNNMAEMGEQIDNLNKMKTKAEKDKGGMERDLQEARAGLDEGMRDKANHERNSKLTAALIVEANQKLDDMARALNDADSSKKKLMVENQDLSRQIDEVENAIAALGKTKISLSTQLADTKRMGDTEARDRASLLAKFKNMSTEVSI